jgi:uncharacterized protein (DUF885 family)
MLRSLICAAIFLLCTAAAWAGPTEDLKAIFDAEWERSMAESPTWASSLGDRRYNTKWSDLSREALEQSHQTNLAVIAKLNALPFDQLSKDDQLNLRLFRREYEFRVEIYPFQWYLIPINQREGIQDAGSLADELQFNSVKDYEDWLGRMEAFPTLMRQTISLMKEGIAKKMLQPRLVMKRLPAQITRQIVDDPTEQLFFKPFKNYPDEIAPAERDRLTAAAKEAVTTKILPAYREFQTFFNDEYLPACFEQVGAWQLPRGDELYAVRCREFTTTELTPDQIHKIGLSEVKRIRAKMEAIVAEVKFEGTFREFLDHLRTDKQFYYANEGELLSAYQAVCKKIDPQLVKLFRKLPRMPYGVEAIPAHIAPDTTAAYYRPPAADGSRAGSFFVNLYRTDSRPKYEIEALSLHESVPGHHLQIALSFEMEGQPRFRKYTGYTAYVEGWALYAESLGGELGLYQDPYSRFGQLTYEMWRAVRLVVDTGIHSKKWTREQAIEYFADNTAKSTLDIENEVDRYISWPGQALAYKIGELKIQELRKRAKAKLGAKFDVREFHDVVLSSGAVPLDVLESLVDAWIASKSAG